MYKNRTRLRKAWCWLAQFIFQLRDSLNVNITFTFFWFWLRVDQCFEWCNCPLNLVVKNLKMKMIPTFTANIILDGFFWTPTLSTLSSVLLIEINSPSTELEPFERNEVDDSPESWIPAPMGRIYKSSQYQSSIKVSKTKSKSKKI